MSDLQLGMEPALDDVLAFIDSFDESSGSSTAPSTPESQDPDEGDTPTAAKCSVERKRTDTRKSAATRRCRHNKRAERLALRVQVEALEKRLAELTRSRPKRTNDPRDPVQELRVATGWLERLVDESRRREEVETRNRELKSVLSQQRQEAKTVHRLLRDVTFWQSLHAVKRPLGPHNADLVDFQDAAVDDLAASIGQMFLDSSSVFEGMDASKGLLMPAAPTVQWDAATGLPYVELKALTCFETSISATLQAIGEVRVGAPYTHHRKHMTNAGLRKDAVMTFDNGVSVDVLSLVQTREDKHRVLSTWASRVIHDPTDDRLRFSERACFMATNTPTGGVLHAYYRVTPEMAFPTNQKSEEAEAMSLFVLQSLGAVMHANYVAVGDLVSKSTLSTVAPSSTS